MTIRDVPDNLHAALKERARKNRRSVNQEVIVELSAAAGLAGGDEAAQRWERANALVEEMRAGMKHPMTAEEIDAAIEEDRR